MAEVWQFQWSTITFLTVYINFIYKLLLELEGMSEIVPAKSGYFLIHYCCSKQYKDSGAYKQQIHSLEEGGMTM